MSEKQEPEREDGAEWINPISGLRYRWDAKQKLWVSTHEYPLGPNPMGILGDGVFD